MKKQTTKDSQNDHQNILKSLDINRLNGDFRVPAQKTMNRMSEC